MKKNMIYKVFALLLGTTVFAACDGLDELPDNRTEIDTPEKVALLLTSGYPEAVPAVICELSGDNLVDDNVVVPATHNDAYQKFHDEAYHWEDINNYSLGQQDTPYAVWESYYQGIAVANHAIEAMKTMSPNPAADPTLSHSWGEAHVLRAYLHFVLVNVFAEAYKDEALSSVDMAIPYVTEPETTVSVDYSQPQYRKSVAETYRLIEQDLLTGINLIDDSRYQVPAYHFNRNAAHAFAARFYLYKRDYAKCVEHANAALGTNPASILRKWASLNTNTLDAMLNDFNDEKASCNFLLQTTYSLQDRLLTACRYSINSGSDVENVPSTKDIIYDGGGPNWNNQVPAYEGKMYRPSAGSEYGSFLFRVVEYFEYTDKIAGIGYVHILYQPFTAEETLLCRAEAELYLGQTAQAINDLDTWTHSKQVENTLTQDRIDYKYSGTPYTAYDVEQGQYYTGSNIYVSDIHPKEISPEFKLLSDAENRVLQCVLHFRRIETMFEGLRWFDIKRYGITVHHAYKGPQEDNATHDYLKYDDPRRVLQIPNNVLTAGYPPTDRTQPSATNQSSSKTPAPILIK